MIRSAEGSSAVVNAIYLPMAFIAGSFCSTALVPAFLAVIADVLPLTYFIRLMRDIILHGGRSGRARGGGRARRLGRVGALVAVRGFRWEPREA